MLPDGIASACAPILDALRLGGVDVLDVMSMGATDVRLIVEAAGTQFIMRLTPRPRSAPAPRHPIPRRGRAAPRLRVHHAGPGCPRPDWRDQLREVGERLNLRGPQ